MRARATDAVVGMTMERGTLLGTVDNGTARLFPVRLWGKYIMLRSLPFVKRFSELGKMRQVQKFAGNSANPTTVLPLVLDIFCMIHPPLCMIQCMMMTMMIRTPGKPTQKFLRQRLLPLRPPHLLLHLPPFPFVLPPQMFLATQHLGAEIQRILRHLVQRRELLEPLRILGGSRGRFETTTFGLRVVGEGQGVIPFEDGLHVHLARHLVVGGGCCFRCAFCIIVCRVAVAARVVEGVGDSTWVGVNIGAAAVVVA
mmetsp:Transcript_25321/g.41536  ORF Transcript_25321/g.41536 Transcript_25321/m.41536 type:complete len:255 (-) Transcript_25321:12-776(-)